MLAIRQSRARLSCFESPGLPVAEALTAGTPVLASDLPSLRSMSEVGITWLDPLDGPNWLAAIRHLSEAPAPGVQGLSDRARRVFCSQTYFQEVETFLSTV